jgi:hypothetical protein
MLKFSEKKSEIIFLKENFLKEKKESDKIFEGISYIKMVLKIN